MTVGEIISRGLVYFEGLSADDLSAPRNRMQFLLMLQQVEYEVENGRDLKYLYKDATITLAQSGTTSTPPADYRDMGAEGKIYVPTLNRDVDGPKQDDEILSLRYENGQAPRCIEEFGYWNKLFQFAVADAAYSFAIHYLRQSQLLQDSTDPTLVVDDSTVLLMPTEYHYTVLLAGVLSRSNMVKDELRNAQDGIYRSGLAQMYVRERPRRGGIQQWPMQEGVLF